MQKFKDFDRNSDIVYTHHQMSLYTVLHTTSCFDITACLALSKQLKDELFSRYENSISVTQILTFIHTASVL